MTNELKQDVENQVAAVKKALLDNPDRSIKITDHVCAINYSKYAISETWDDEVGEFTIRFDDSDNVCVDDDDFIEYQFQYTELAIELETKYADRIDELRDMQQDEMRILRSHRRTARHAAR